MAKRKWASVLFLENTLTRQKISHPFQSFISFDIFIKPYDKKYSKTLYEVSILAILLLTVSKR